MWVVNNLAHHWRPFWIFTFQRSRRSKRNHSSASSTATSANENESPQKSSKKSSSKQSSAKKSGAAAAKSRSASSASSSGSESSPKKSADKKSKKSSKESKKDPAPRAVPKKSATAKPIAKAVTTTKKQLSDNDSGLRTNSIISCHQFFQCFILVFTCGTQILKHRLKNAQVPPRPPPNPPPGNHLEVFRQACFTSETPKNFPVSFPLKLKFFQKPGTRVQTTSSHCRIS